MKNEDNNLLFQTPVNIGTLSNNGTDRGITSFPAKIANTPGAAVWQPVNTGTPYVSSTDFYPAQTHFVPSSQGTISMPKDELANFAFMGLGMPPATDYLNYLQGNQGHPINETSSYSSQEIAQNIRNDTGSKILTYSILILVGFILGVGWGYIDDSTKQTIIYGAGGLVVAFGIKFLNRAGDKIIDALMSKGKRLFN